MNMSLRGCKRPAEDGWIASGLSADTVPWETDAKLGMSQGRATPRVTAPGHLI
ncbi:MAG: hypothetical protein GWP08_10090 [Nitrospiraceae bacterium]|nr:hypothetical protein [Nitrospiraceae bacterium]